MLSVLPGLLVRELALSRLLSYFPAPLLRFRLGEFALFLQAFEVVMFLATRLKFIRFVRLPRADNVDQVRYLEKQHKSDRHHGENCSPLALVDHERRQPTLELVRERRHHKQKGGQERQQQKHRRPLGKN